MVDTVTSMGDDEAVVLTINAAVAFGGTWLSARIGRFQIRYPDLAVRLSMSNDYVDFDASNVDVAIRIGRGGWPGLTSEERRVGKDGVSTWRCRWSPYH